MNRKQRKAKMTEQRREYGYWQQKYIDSVSGEAHQSALEIIGKLEGHNEPEWPGEKDVSQYEAAGAKIIATTHNATRKECIAAYEKAVRG